MTIYTDILKSRFIFMYCNSHQQCYNFFPILFLRKRDNNYALTDAVYTMQKCFKH